MKDVTIGQFLERLASSDPTPGGGSASALAGAMAAALVAMVARLSQGKGGDDEALVRTVHWGERARETLTTLAEQDAQAFDGVMRAMRMPRGTELEKRARTEASQQALRSACDVPLQVMRAVLDVLRETPALARSGNLNAVSDVVVAVLLGYAAVQGALHNVRINLASIKDEEYVTATRTDAERLGSSAAELRDQAMAAVRERM
jgi:formiminotetrahydrofolate cyclodeaminase